MTHRLMPDNQLVQLMAQGDHEALAELRDRHGLSVYAQLYVMLGNADAAERVVAETWDQAWLSAGGLNPRAGSVLVWLSSLGRSLAASRAAAAARGWPTWQLTGGSSRFTRSRFLPPARRFRPA